MSDNLPALSGGKSYQKTYPVSEAARLLGVSAETLRRWDKLGKLKPFRTKGGQRRYSLANLEVYKSGERSAKIPLKISQAAKYVGVHPETLRRWEREGMVTPERTTGGQRRYTKEYLDKLFSKTELPVFIKPGEPAEKPKPEPLPEIPEKVPVRMFESYKPAHTSHLRLMKRVAVLSLALGLVVMFWFDAVSGLAKERLKRIANPSSINPIVDVNDIAEYQTAGDLVSSVKFKFPLETAEITTAGLVVLHDAALNTTRFLGTAFFGWGNDYYIDPQGDGALRNLDVENELTVSKLEADLIEAEKVKSGAVETSRLSSASITTGSITTNAATIDEATITKLNVQEVSAAGTTTETFTLDTDNTGGDLSLIFGAANGENLTWDAAAIQFTISDDLSVAGSIAAVGGTTLSGTGVGFDFSGTGNHLIQSSGGTLQLGAFTLNGAVTGDGQNITGLNNLTGATSSFSTSVTSPTFRNGGDISVDAFNAVANSTVSVLNSDPAFAANLDVEGDITAGGAIGGGAATFSSLTVLGTSDLQGAVSDSLGNLQLADTVEISENLFLTSATPVIDANNGLATLEINTTTNRPVTFGTGLVTANNFASSSAAITGGSIDSTPVGQVTAAAGSFTTLSSTGVTTLGNGTASVAVNSSDWAIDANGTMTGISGITNDGGYTQTGASANTFSGATSFTAAGTALTVDNNALVSGDLTAGRVLTPEVESAGNLTLDARNAAANSTVYVLNSDPAFSAGLDVEGDTSIGGNLTVLGGGTHSFAGTLDPTNVAAFTLTGDITGSGGPNITGIGQFSGNSFTDGTLTITGGNITGGLTANFATKVVTPEIENTGDITVDAINLAADSTIFLLNSDAANQANLDVEGDITAGGSVSGGAASFSSLLVTGTSDLRGDVLDTLSNLTLADTVDITENLNFTSATPVIDANNGLATLEINTTTNRPVTFGTGLVTANNFASSSAAITGGSIDSTPVGSSDPSSGAFSTLSANSDVDFLFAGAESFVISSSISGTAAVDVSSTAFSNNTTSGTQRMLVLQNSGTGTTEAGLLVSNTGTGTTAIEISGAWGTGIATSNNSINAGSGSITSGAINASGTLTVSSGGASITGDLSLDGDLSFAGPQQITTTTGNLTIDSAGTLVVADPVDLNNTLDLDANSASALTVGDGATDTLVVDTSADDVTVAGAFYQTGGSPSSFSGNVTLGDASTDTITFTGQQASHLIPETNNWYDLGSPTNKYANIYAVNLVVESTSAEGTISDYFIINSDNPTADLQDSQLEFSRGTVSPNAIVKWDSANDEFDFNFPANITSTAAPQLKLSYNSSNYLTTQVGIAGAVVFDAVGAGAAFSFSDATTISSGDLVVSSGQLTVSAGGASITGGTATDTLTVSSTATFNGVSTFNTDVNYTLAEAENLAISNTVSGTTSVDLVSAALSNNTTSGTQRGLALTFNGSGVTDVGALLTYAGTGSGTTALEIAGTWGTGILTNNNSINAGTGSITGGTGSFSELSLSGPLTITSSTTPQLSVRHDASNRWDTSISATGAVSFDAVGAAAGFAFADNVTLSGASAILNFSSATGAKQIQTGGTTDLALMPGGDVGIGTTTPNDKLEIAGGHLRINSTYQINKYGDVSEPIVRTRRTDETQEGQLRTNGWGDFTFSKSAAVGYDLAGAPAGTGNFYASGSVGIGTTDPSSGLTLGDGAGTLRDLLLSKENIATAVTQYSSNDLILQGSGWNTTTLAAVDLTGRFRLTPGSGATGAVPYRIGVFDNTPTEFVSFDLLNQRVGIGDTSPIAHLVVGSDAGATYANGSGDVYIQNDLEVDGTIYGGAIALPGLTVGSVIFAGADGQLTQDNPNFFWNDTLNRLGIGNNNPGYKLEVTGDARVTSSLYFGTLGAYLSTDQGGSLELGPANDPGGQTPYLDFHYGIGSAQNWNYRIVNSGNNILEFKESGGGTSFVINAGDVGIGVGSTPGQKLQVAGNVAVSNNSGFLARNAGNSAWYELAKLDTADIARYGNSTLNIELATGEVGIGLTTPTGKLQVSGDEVRIGNAGTVDWATSDGDLYVEDALEVDGTIYYGDGQLTKQYYLTRTLPIVVDDYVEIGNFSLASGAHSLKVNITVSSSGFSVAKEYLLPMQYDQTGAGVWREASAISDTGVYSSQDFSLQVQVSLATAYLRIRRSVGTTAGTAVVTIEQLGSSADVFTAQTGTGTTSAQAIFEGTPLTQVNGNVGIGTTTPGANLHIYQNAPSVDQVLFKIGTSDNATRFTVDEDGDVFAWGGFLNYGRIATASDIVANYGAILNDLGNDSDTRIEGDTDPNLVFVDASADRVGIGTASPQGKLDVVGQMYTSDYSYFGGTVSTGLRLKGTDTANTIYQNTGNLSITATTGNKIYLSLVSSPTTGLTVDTTTGNVGIGNTAPALSLEVGDITLGVDATNGVGIQGDLEVEDFALLGALRVGSTGTDPGAGNAYLEGDLTVSGGNISVTNNNGGVDFNDVNSYWLRTATNYGLYWDTTNNTWEWHSGGVDKWSVDLSGNVIQAGNLDVNGTSNDIAGTLNLSGGALTSTGALTITPQAGNNLNIALSTTGDFAVNTDDLYVDTSAGNVGIGTASPQAGMRVDVRSDGGIDGSSAITGYGYNGNGGMAIRGYGYATSGTGYNYGLYGVSSGARASGTNVGGYFTAVGAATNYALITGDGNVGIGDTGPDASLEVVNDGSGDSFLVADTNDGDTTPFVIQSDGDVGIGTAGPGAKLDVVGNAEISSYLGVGAEGAGSAEKLANFFQSYAGTSTAYGINAQRYQSTNGNTNSIVGIFGQGGAYNLGANTLSWARGIQGYAYQSGTGTVTSAASLYASSPTGTLTNAYGIYLENVTAGSSTNYSIYSAGGQSYFAGNVGIGTASPGAKLDVRGQGVFGVSGSVGFAAPLTTSGAEVNLSSNSLITFGESVAANANPAITMYRTDAGFRTGKATRFYQPTSAGELYFQTGTSSTAYGSETYTTNMTILAGGNVGIGDTTPAAHLVVGSDAGATYANGTGDVYIQNDLEVDGVIYGGTTFNCIDCINFDDLADALTLDAATDIALGALTLSTSGTGALDFNSTGQVSFAGNVNAENGLDVTTANLTVGGANFSVAPATGNITTAGTITLPNSNTLTGVANYTRFSQGVSVGGADTYYIASSGNAKFLDLIAADTGNPGLTVGDGTTGYIKVGGSTIYDAAGSLILDSDSGYVQTPDYYGYTGLQWTYSQTTSNTNLLASTSSMASYDVYQWATVESVEYDPGTGWETWSSSTMERAFDDNANTGVTVDATHKKFRFVINTGAWGCPGMFLIERTYAAPAPSYTITIETDDNTGFTSPSTEYSGSQLASLEQFYISDPVCNADSYHRFTVDATEAFALFEISAISTRSAGSGVILPPYQKDYTSAYVSQGLAVGYSSGQTVPSNGLLVSGNLSIVGSSTLGDAATDTNILRGLITLTDSASSYPLRFGADVDLYRSAANTLALATGDSLTLVSGNYTQTSAATTTNAMDVTANSLTSGKALNIASSGTAFTGNLIDVTLSGSNAANTGSLLSLTNSGALNTGTTLYLKHYATGTNNLAMRVDDISGDTTPFVIDGGGNVGIGTTSPAAPLQIGTNFNAPVTSTDLFINAGGGDTNGVIQISPDGNGSVGAVINGYFNNSLLKQYLYLGTIGYSGVEKTMTIVEGNVGIGTTGPLSNLDIVSETVGYVSTGYRSFAGAQHWYSGAGISGVSIQPYFISTSVSGVSSAMSVYPSGNIGIGYDAEPTGKLAINGSVGIGTIAPEFKLSLETDGGIIAKGNVGAGATLTTSGNGTRLIWYPLHAAFRVGEAVGDRWDDLNIGDYSFATGNATKADGIYSTAMGYGAIASGRASLSFGEDTVVSGQNGTAIGFATTASGAVSTSIGSDSIASGAYSMTTGFALAATNDFAMVIGQGISSGTTLTNSTASSLAIGFNSTVPTLFVGPSSGAGTFGNVGIGDTTPDGRLDVESTGAVTASTYGINLSNLVTNTTTDGINKYGAYLTSTGGFGGLGGAVTSNWGLYVDTVSGADLNYGAYFANNVGIGDSSPAALLTVGANDLFQVASTGNLTTANAGTWTFSNDTNFALSGGVNGLSFDTSTLSIDALNHRVGIGTTSIPTGFVLDIDGSVRLRNAAATRYRSDWSVAAGGLNINAFDDTGGVYIPFRLDGLSFAMRADASDAKSMTLSNSGDVGIGDAGPDGALDIERATAAHTDLQIDNTNAGDFDPRIQFDLGGTDIFTIGVDDSDSDKFKIGTTALETNTRLTIDSTGYVGIGTDAPGKKLDLRGTMAFYGSGTVPNYLTQGAGNNMQINTNVDEANVIGDTAKSQWKLILGSAADTFTVRRSPAGAIYTESTLLTVDGATGNVLIGTSANPFGGTVRALVISGDVADAVAVDNILAAYGGAGGGFAGYRGLSASGTVSAPGQTKANRGAFLALAGHDGTNYVSQAKAIIFLRAAEDWTPTAQGTFISFGVTPIGSTSRADAMTILGSGNVGIGTTGPESQVQISSGGLCVGSDANCNTDNDTEGIVYSSSISMTVYDVAEDYPTKDQTLVVGEVVALDSQNEVFVKRAAVGDFSLGVISAKPGVHLGGFNGTQFEDERQVAVGLSGRILVKVNSEGGEIGVGDPLTVSSVPGVTKKATSSGRVIGYALENYSASGVGLIQFFINPGWYDPGVLVDSGGDVAQTNPDGSTTKIVTQTVEAEEGVFERITVALEAAVSTLRVEVAEIASATIGNLNTTGKIISPVIEVENLQARNIESEQIKTATLEADTVKANRIEGVEFEQVTNVTNVTNVEQTVVSNPESGLEAVAKFIKQITENLTVTGKIISPVVEADTVQAQEGIFQRISVVMEAVFESITAKTAQIASAVIENLTAVFVKTDKVEAGKVTVDEVVVTDKTSGQATILAGESELLIANSLVTETSKVFVTFRDSYAPATNYWVSEVVAGESFTVTLDQPTTADSRFDYWIVN